MRRLFNVVNTVTIGLCGVVMIALGTWMPSLVEAPPSPRIKLETASEV
jgi:hypothetical protein